MGPISAEIEIDVPRERAFAAIADLALRPSFTDHFLSGFHLTRIDPTGVGAGARFRAEAPLRSVWMDTTIVAADEPFRIVERGRGGRANRIPNHTVWELTEASGGADRGAGLPLDRAWRRSTAAWSCSAPARSGRSAAGARRCAACATGSSPTQQPAERVAIAGGNRYATGIP